MSKETGAKMTIVEFYDSDPIENAVSLLLEGADKIIYIGYNSKQLKRVIEDYSEIASNKGILVEFDSKTANRNDLLSITTVLESVVEAEKECVFDLSGGEKRRVAIAGVISMKPKVLVLDEPTAGLDPVGKNDLLQLMVY